MGEEGRQGKFRSYLPYSLLLAAYLFVGALASHPFDDAVYAQNAQFFYFFRIPPVFSLPMGLYYDLINVGGYFLTILFGLLKIQNVITIQIGVKIPFIIFAFLTAFILYKIGKDMHFDGKYASLILLTSPTYFFTALIYGSAIIVSVFFLIASLLFIIRRRTALSAIFYGMSMGSYLYPMIAIPFLLRYFWVREGKRSTGIFLLLSSVFASIGQLVAFLLYFSKGIQIQAPISPNTFFAPMISVQPYSPLDILNIFNLGKIVPGETINILYYGSAIIGSLIYLALPKDKVNLSSLVIFLFIQSILFSSLAPGNLPSYMAAEIPLAVIVAFMFRRWIFIGLMWISSFFSFWVMQSINSVGFVIYFSDLNQNILKMRNSYPSWVVSLTGSIYAISILLNLLFLRKKKEKRDLIPRKTMVFQYSVIGAIVITAIVILVPVMSSIPAVMFLTPQVNTFEAQEASFAIVDGNLVVNYSMPLILEYGNFQGKYVSGFIYYNQTPITLYNYSTTDLMSGNNSYNISFPYPVNDVALTLFSPAAGNISLYLEHDGKNYFPLNSSVLSGGESEHLFHFASTLDGNYSLIVESKSQYYSTPDFPSLFAEGRTTANGVSVDNVTEDGAIPSHLISDHMSITFKGLFLKAPPFLPELYIAVNSFGPTLFLPYVAAGALIFCMMIIFSVLFLRRF